MTYAGQAALTRLQGFRDQVQIAITNAATAIGGEAQAGMTPAVYGKRQSLAYQVLRNPSGYTDLFVWAVAQNTALTFYQPIQIVSSTTANPTVITTGAHGYSTGDMVVVANHAVNTAANGIWPITVLSSTTFSVPIAGNGSGLTTGTATKLPLDSDIQFTVNSVWNDVAGVTGLD